MHELAEVTVEKSLKDEYNRDVTGKLVNSQCKKCDISTWLIQIRLSMTQNNSKKNKNVFKQTYISGADAESSAGPNQPTNLTKINFRAPLKNALEEKNNS